MSAGDSAVVSRSRLQAGPGADSAELHSESIEGGCVGGSELLPSMGIAVGGFGGRRRPCWLAVRGCAHTGARGRVLL